MPEIEGERLAGQQMDGDGVARKSVHRQDVVVLRRLPLHGEPSIPKHHFHLPLRFGHKTELAARYADHQRIDVVKAVDIAWPSVRGYRARTQTDHANTQPQPPFGLHNRQSDAALIAVV